MRRLEDAGVSVMVLEDAGRAESQGSVGPQTMDVTGLLPGFSPIEMSRTALLIDLPENEVLLLPAADAQVLGRGEDEEDTRRRAVSAAAMWLRERHRLQRRIRLPDWLMAYVDELQRATTAAQVHLALLACTTQVASAFTAIAYLPGENETTGFLQPLQHADESAAPTLLPLAAATRFTTVCIMTDVEARDSTRASHAALAPVFAAFSAAQLVCLPVGADAVHILVERRRKRVFTAEDRDMLGWVVRQAERTLAALSASETTG